MKVSSTTGSTGIIWDPPNGPDPLLYSHRDVGDLRLSFTGGGSDQVRFTPGGDVIIAGTLTASSDARFKADIRPLDSVLPKLDRLHGVSYEPSALALAMGRPSGHREIGIVGQELEQVFPELVLRSSEEEGYRSVDYGRLSVVLLEALKELKEQQKEQHRRIETLEAELRKTKK